MKSQEILLKNFRKYLERVVNLPTMNMMYIYYRTSFKNLLLEWL